MASATAKVFAVPELLEAVLLKLPRIRLFEVCRINKTWRDTINTSPKLRQRLFLDFERASNRPHSGANEEKVENKVNSALIYLINNSLIYKPLGSESNAYSYVAPLKCSPYGSLRYSVNFFMSRSYNSEAFVKHLRTRGAGRKASWRAMKLTRLREAVRVEISVSWRNSNWGHPHVVEFAAGGSRPGDLVDAMDRIGKDVADKACRDQKLLTQCSMQRWYDYLCLAWGGVCRLRNCCFGSGESLA